MIQRYDLEHAAAVLEQEGLVLLPSESLWYIACAADDPVAVARLRRIKPTTAEQPYELVFSSLDMLKAFAPDLHPRLETLLHYHRRPLTVLTTADADIPYTALLPGHRMAARIAHDVYCRHLIQLINRPLATALAYFPGSALPNHFGRVRSDIIESVDYVVKYRPKEVPQARPTLLVQLDEMDELEFLR